MPFLSGVTLIRNGNDLNYPWLQCLSTLNEICDEVVLNVDPTSEDDTLVWAEIVQNMRGITLVKNEWDMRNTGDGRELARQANLACDAAQGEWILYLQADEFVHEKDAEKLRDLLDGLPKHVTQVELYRTYFWGDLSHRNVKEEIFLGRVFRKGTHRVGGDGMYLIRDSGEVFRSDIWIYHYSRVGDESLITKRVRQLDTLFHPKEKVEEFSDFKYGDVPDIYIVEYDGPHPRSIMESLEYFNA